jgi:DNA-binding transcriptional MocR family regulator
MAEKQLGEHGDRMAPNTRSEIESRMQTLRQAIERNDLPRGTRLPAERGLAQSLAVSRGTVVAAYDILGREGLLERRQGSGSWISHRGVGNRGLTAAGSDHEDGRPVLRGLTETPSNSIDFLGAHLPGDGIDWDDLVSSIAGGLAAAGSSHGYAPAGLPELRTAVAAELGRTGLPTTEDQVMVTSGAQQAISLIAALYVRAGDTVLLENPTYPGAIDAFLACGARLAPIAVGSDGARLGALRDKLRDPSARLVYLIPTFQNPTGTSMPATHRAEAASAVAEAGLPLVEDATLASLSLGDAPARPIAACAEGAAVITVGSLGKFFWGGLRVGWVRGPEAVITKLSRLKAIADLGTSIPSQLMAVRLLERAGEVERLRQAQIAERFGLAEALLREHVPSWQWKRPAGGLSLWIGQPKGTATEFAQVALRHGVAVAPGPLMSPNNVCNDHIRLAFMRDNDVLVEGVSRLAAAWREYDTSPRLRSAAPRVLL